MNWVTGIVVFTITWWLVLFCVLPIGIRPAEEGHLGHDAGAPANPRIGFKMLLTTAIAAAVFVAIYLVIQSGWSSFRGMLHE